jgi:replication factor C small subunit
MIARKEAVQLTQDGIQAIIYVSAGDLRKAINVLQASGVTQKKVDADAVYTVTGKARPEEVSQMINAALEGRFAQAQEKLQSLLVWQGLAGEDVIRQIHREVLLIGVDEAIKVQLVDVVGEAEYRLAEGADPEIQLSYILARFALVGSSRGQNQS